MFWEKFLLLCKEKGESPTYVCKKLGYSSTMVTNWKRGSVPRDSTLLKIADYFGVPADYFKEEQQTATIASETQPLDRENLRMVPLYESVAAGFGAYASEDIQDYMPAYFHNPADADSTICIKVKGDSMRPKIEDGDIIQVHKQESVDNGQIAVVMVDDTDGYVKIVHYDSTGIDLQSLNPHYAPLRFKGNDAARIRVVGLVTQVIKGINGRTVQTLRNNDAKKELLDSIDQMDAQQLKEFNKMFNEYMRSKEKK